MFLDRANSNWSVKSRRVIVGRTGVNYAYIEPLGCAIYVASDSPYYMVEDSENPIVQQTKADDKCSNEAAKDTSKTADSESKFSFQ